MRLITIFLVTIFIGLALFWTWVNYPQVRNKALDLISAKQAKTLEVHYTAESLMENHKKELLKDNQHSFLEPKLLFQPYLLMDVKYSKSQDKTGEGIILWSLIDGEMVINSSIWDKTHGFSDCIRAGADKDDFKLINALATHGSAMDRDALQKFLNMEGDALDWILEDCIRKNLIVQRGNYYRLHFENPKLEVTPETKLDQWLVTKECKSRVKMSPKYRAAQIENTARAAFGRDFTIRKSTEIYLPVYSIAVQNPDGSQMVTYWNALNGKKLSPKFDLE